MKKTFLVCISLLLLSACASEPPPVVAMETDSAPKINLDVLTVTVVDRSNSQTGDTPYLTNNFQPTIAAAMRRWATEKIIAVGTTGEAVVTIHEASLKSEPIAHSDALFTREQTIKYVGHLAVDIDVSGRPGAGRVTASASRFETLPDLPSTAERQAAYMTLLNGLMKDISNNLRNGIQSHIGNFVVAAPPDIQ